MESAGAMETGPDDARCLIWALGELFFIFLPFYYATKKESIFYSLAV